MRELERVILLKNVDTEWMDHIDAMDELQKGIRLRAYGQKDPVVEYRMEGFDMFDEMISTIRENTARMMLTVQLRTAEEPKREQVAKPTGETGGDDSERQEAHARPQKEEAGPQRPVPLRQRQEIQELLRALRQLSLTMEYSKRPGKSPAPFV